MISNVNLLDTPEYSFLKTDKHLGKNVILLALGGSYAYGTNISTSDIDLRGCSLNTKQELLLGKDFEQISYSDPDTVIYSFNKFIALLLNANPNVIEILGCKPEHYLYVSDIGKELLKNKQLFLSKKCIQSFGGYATAQLRRLNNKSATTLESEKQQQHVLNSINNASYSFKEKYYSYTDNDIRLYIDRGVHENTANEIFMDAQIKHYPVKDFVDLTAEMNSIINSYNKLGSRNSKAIEHGKLGKHMMHLVRLNLMCLDILENEDVVTYRSKEHDLLMSIRNGDYLDNQGQPTKEFFDIVNDLENKQEQAAKRTQLPSNPDIDKINQFVMSVNERIICNSI